MAARLAAAMVALGAAAYACGEVPTLPDNIAFISPVLLPAPAVAVGDKLRDSTGTVAPLRIVAFDVKGDTIRGVTASFIVTSLPADSGVTIDANGIVTALGAAKSVQIVGRIGDRLQTPPITLDVVQPADSIMAGIFVDTASLPVLKALPVSVTGVPAGGGPRAGVKGIIVRYRIVAKYGNAPDSARAVLTNSAGALSRPDSTAAVDTSDASGMAGRTTLVVSGGGVDSIEVRASALSLKGVALKGSPVRLLVRIKR